MSVPEVALWATLSVEEQQALGVVMTPPEREALEALITHARALSDGRAWVESYLWIEPKESGGRVPLHFNPIQERYWRDRSDRDIILKARQHGISTLILAEMFWRACTTRNYKAISVADNGPRAQGLFQKVLFFYEHLPLALRKSLCSNPDKPRYANVREIYLDKVESRIEVGSAEDPQVGRSATYHSIHGSEVAFWPRPQDQLSGLLQTLERRTGIVRLESTAKGAGTWYHETYAEAVAMKGQGTYRPHFYAWHINPAYVLDPATVPAFTDPEDLRQERLALEAYQLSAEQLAFRRHAVRENRGLFPQEFPSYWQEAFLVSGRPVFERRAIQQRLDEVAQERPLREEDNGCLVLFEDPEPGVGYVLSADVAEGKTVQVGQAGEGGSDYSAAVLLRADSGRQVGHYRGRPRPGEYGVVLAALGRRYNKALLVVERNNHGHAVIEKLKDLDYPCLYVHATHGQLKGDGEFGWLTTERSRALALAHLQNVLARGIDWIASREVLVELNTFVHSHRGRMEAQAGTHDDLVMSLAIACYVLPQVPRYRRVLAVDRTREAPYVRPDGDYAGY